jgi:hypothetical protein
LGAQFSTPEEAACMRASVVKNYFAQQKRPTVDLKHQAIEKASVKRKSRAFSRSTHQTHKENSHVV